MTLDEATTAANGIALRFAEFAIRDEESALEWEAIVRISPHASGIARENVARYRKRAESRDHEAKALLLLLLTLSEMIEEKTNGRRRNSTQKSAGTNTRAAADAIR
jgi:hypothetical protein